VVQTSILRCKLRFFGIFHFFGIFERRVLTKRKKSDTMSLTLVGALCGCAFDQLFVPHPQRRNFSIMKRVFVRRVVMVFCCLAGLAWAGYELTDPPSRMIDVSNDTLIADLRVGGDAKRKCGSSTSCPGRCVLTGYSVPLLRVPNYDPCDPDSWYVAAHSGSRGGCTLAITNTYRQCIADEKCAICIDGLFDRCGFLELLRERNDGFDPIRCYPRGLRIVCSTILLSTCKPSCGL